MYAGKLLNKESGMIGDENVSGSASATVNAVEAMEVKTALNGCEVPEGY